MQVVNFQRFNLQSYALVESTRNLSNFVKRSRTNLEVKGKEKIFSDLHSVLYVKNCELNSWSV